MRRSALMLSGLFCLGAAVSMPAQEARRERGESRKSAKSQKSAGRSGRGRDAGFEKSKPAVGDLLPDVSAYDDQGRKFALKSLRGSYSVITFGCLT